ncbi:MAG: sialidase family protein [Planctomycetota bacterium]|nr:sialidase family protein [Planctomycetota bacterium]
MQGKIDRRTWLLGTGALAGGVAFHMARSAQAAPAVKLLETRVISPERQLYYGWPTLARRRNGQLLLVYSGGRESHVCPFGRVELMRSDDDGQTWSWPEVVLDAPIDDRDAGVVETAKGSILITTFTSLAYESTLQKAERDGNWPADRLARWQAAHRRVSAEGRQAALGEWMIRSTDGGILWSGRYACEVDSPHGPIQLSDGRLLYAGKELWHGAHRVGVCESKDDGQSWRWLATIPNREGDDPQNYHELHAVETADQRLLVQVRNHNRANSQETLQCESADGGQTWAPPRSIGVWGLPSHLLRLRDDRLLMTYGHRRAPLGNQARLSEDHGRTWSEPLLISADGTSGDLGYPSTVQLADGALLTVWYELLKGSDKAVLRQARWSLSS